MLKKSIIIIVLVLLIDQISKIYIKTNFIYGEEVVVFDWFRIHFIENNGGCNRRGRRFISFQWICSRSRRHQLFWCRSLLLCGRILVGDASDYSLLHNYAMRNNGAELPETGGTLLVPPSDRGGGVAV